MLRVRARFPHTAAVATHELHVYGCSIVQGGFGVGNHHEPRIRHLHVFVGSVQRICWGCRSSTILTVWLCGLYLLAPRECEKKNSETVHAGICASWQRE